MRKRIILSAKAIAAICTACTPQATTNAHGSSAQTWGQSSSSTPTTPVAPPTAADFIIGVVVTEQKCFGSAGCNYHFTINPQYVDTKELPPKTIVIYKITGGGDQDQIGNFTIDKVGMATFDRESTISGTAGANLQAIVTSVLLGR